MFKLDKDKSNRIATLVLAGLISVNMVGCSSKTKSNDNETSVATQVETTDVNFDYVNQTKGKLKSMFPSLKDETIENFALIILLNSLAPKNEQGKINADIISKYKNNIDADNMMSDFNAVMDTLEYSMIKEERVIPVSTVLPLEYENDRVILSKIETITSNIISLVNSEATAEAVLEEYNKLHILFVEEKEIEIDGVKVDVRSLDYGNRAVAEGYARTALYFARNYLTDELIEAMDARTNDQNNKYYIKSNLEILDNEMEEVSETDVVGLFNKQYDSTYKTVSGNISAERDSVIDLVNYLNMEYLDSNRVSYKDKTTVLGEYSDSDVSNVLMTIDAIDAYNLKNTNNIILYSYMLVDDYKLTDEGKVDAVALDFVQYNAIMLLQTTNVDDSFNIVFNNPYFKNLYKYFTKQDFTHTYGDGVEKNIVWQDISDGANFVCYEIIRETLSKLNCKDLECFKELVDQDLTQTIQYIQNTITGECEKVDLTTYVK